MFVNNLMDIFKEPCEHGHGYEHSFLVHMVIGCCGGHVYPASAIVHVCYQLIKKIKFMVDLSKIFVHLLLITYFHILDDFPEFAIYYV